MKSAADIDMHAAPRLVLAEVEDMVAAMIGVSVRNAIRINKIGARTHEAIEEVEEGSWQGGREGGGGESGHLVQVCKVKPACSP